MTAPTPREQAAEVLEKHGSCSWSEDASGMTCDGCGDRIQGVGLSRHQADMLAAAGVLLEREEWGGMWHDSDGKQQVESFGDDEQRAREWVAPEKWDGPGPTLVHRYTGATEWRTA